MTGTPTDQPRADGPKLSAGPASIARVAFRAIASVIRPAASAPPNAPNPAEPDVTSPDTRREIRLPPGQVRAKKWPVLHAGATPKVDLDRWTFRIDGLVDHPATRTWAEFAALPRSRVFADMHCVTRWSLLDNTWEGVRVRDLIAGVGLHPDASFAVVHGLDGYTTNLPLADLLGDDCLIALGRNGQPLTPEHGWPARVIVPRLYAWKGAKWANRIEILAIDRPGFWEVNGYHNHGDPWAQERFS